MTDATTMDEIAAEINLMKRDVIRLKIKALTIENDTLRQKLKLNANKKRHLKHQLEELRKQNELVLPF